jgi:hypothetical protein
MPETRAVQAFLDSLEAETRRVADGEWGITTEAAGWPLHVGVALRDDLLRAQAEVLPAGALDPHDLLHRNRTLALVRFTHTSAGAVWIEGDLPRVAVDAAELDRLLGLLVAAATDARYAARRRA